MEALPDIDPSLCPKVQVADYLGRIDEFPVAKCYLRCPFYTGLTDAVRAPIKFASALVGNISGAQDPDSPDSLLSNENHSLYSNHDQATTDVSSLQDPLSPLDDSPSPGTSLSSQEKDNLPSGCQHLPSVESSTTQVSVVETRAGRSKRVHLLVLPKLHPLSVIPDEFRQLQESCPSLKCLRTKATTREVDKARNGVS